ncbi:MAG: hypothetical protein ABFD98_20250 [Syntrophobacteraceae bacterium]|nr:hypothetical protein [Desulfobacteraceae bacterium]
MSLVKVDGIEMEIEKGSHVYFGEGGNDCFVKWETLTPKLREAFDMLDFVAGLLVGHLGENGIKEEMTRLAEKFDADDTAVQP